MTTSNEKTEELLRLVSAYEKVEMMLEKESARQEDLDEEGSKRLFLQSVLSERIQLLLLYHREDILDTKRHVTLGKTTLGFRFLAPQVIKRRGRTWQEVIEEIKRRNLPFLRNEHQIDEERILLMRSSVEWMKDLRSVGLDVVQDESFFIETEKTEELEKAIQPQIKV